MVSLHLLTSHVTIMKVTLHVLNITTMNVSSLLHRSVVMGGKIGMPESGGFAMLGYLSFSSAAAYTIWSQLLKYNPVSKVAVLCFMTPVFGVILSALLLNEAGQISMVQGAVALILITVGILISHHTPKAIKKD